MPMSIRVSSGTAKVLLPQIVPSFTNERPRESTVFPCHHQKGLLDLRKGNSLHGVRWWVRVRISRWGSVGEDQSVRISRWGSVGEDQTVAVAEGTSGWGTVPWSAGCKILMDDVPRCSNLPLAYALVMEEYNRETAVSTTAALCPTDRSVIPWGISTIWRARQARRKQDLVAA